MAESGHLPDAVMRMGIRRLLRGRLRTLREQHGPGYVEDFLRATQAQPIAIASDKANDQHYEVPAKFFETVLGSRLKYSSCYWPEGIDSLDAAEDEALRVTCSHAGLEDGMDVLELGCGWGSLSLWMAEHYPNSQITSVSNSGSQREFILRRAEERGLDNLTVITADMNDFVTEKAFDRVLSVEMFEHMRNHQRLMERIDKWLRPGGCLFVHIFCHKESPYLFRSDGEQNWMGRYFFTGGMMPSADLLVRCGSPLELVSKWKWNGIHYAKTCRAWLAKQDENSVMLNRVFAETYGVSEARRWHNRWRMFFMACEELFAFNGGNEWFVSHYLFESCPKN